MYLEKIGSPEDLRKIPPQELGALAEEVRLRILEVVSSTGGHLASSLGAVELTIALHYCFDTPRDKIVWDVGHQAYAHKILTGRNREFSCLRQYKGLTGFPCKDESVFDTFTTGHSSTAVSLGLGLVCARELLPEEERFRVVSVIGDGSLSGGLCFEGLNNAGHLKKDMLVVLNTNELSISPNVGAISTYLNKIISLPVYNRFHGSLEDFLKSRIPNGGRILKLVNKFEEGLKGLFIPGMLFEELGFRYFGPFDGHDLNTLIPSLKKIIGLKGPLLLHVVTRKGKGYPPAENDPVRFHGTGPFDLATGASKKAASASRSYTEVFGAKLAGLAGEDKRIVAITAAMPEGTGLDKFRELYPERFFDVGIAESHAVCFAAGLARKGLKPVVAIYSTFLQRAYDQIIECASLQGLGVVFALDRAGIVGEDGPTHQGVFDIAYLRNIPNLVVMAPKDGAETEACLEFALKIGKPAALRYPRDKACVCGGKTQPWEMGKAEMLRPGKQVLIVALGAMVAPSLAAAEILSREGIEAGVINARFVKPLDIELIKSASSGVEHLVTVEEGVLEGGFGSAVQEVLGLPVNRIGLPSEFIPCGKREFLLNEYGLSPEGIAGKIRQIVYGKS